MTTLRVILALCASWLLKGWLLIAVMIGVPSIWFVLALLKATTKDPFGVSGGVERSETQDSPCGRTPGDGLGLVNPGRQPQKTPAGLPTGPLTPFNFLPFNWKGF